MYLLELIHKDNLKDTQLIIRSEFQQITAFLTAITETLTQLVLYLSLQIRS